MNMRDLIPWGRNSNNHQAPSIYREGNHNPFLSLQRDMNRLFDDVFRSFDSHLPALGAFGSFGGFGAPWPSVEISDTDKEIRVTAEVPGLEENDIEVLLDGDVLTLRGEKRYEAEDKDRQFTERYYGRFERRIPIGTEVEEDRIEARFRNGVLTVVLPKSEQAQSQVKRIQKGGTPMMKSTYFRDRNPTDVVNILAGLGLALSPWFLEFTAVTAAAWNAWLVGAVIALVAIWDLVSFRKIQERAIGVLGLWAIVAPWVLGFAELSSATAAHVILGLVVAVVAAGTIWSDNDRPHLRA